MSNRESQTTSIYIVIGTTGEHSYLSEWVVCAYSEEAQAIEHAKMATQEAARIFASKKQWRWEADDAALLWDPHMKVDYTGTDYTVEEAPMRTTLPECQEQKP